MFLRHATGTIDSAGCLVMGIVNRTPDSFYDGGRMSLEESVDHGLALVDQGADLLDLGGIKAGPGEEVTEAEELARVIPLVETLAAKVRVPLSVETARPEVARRAFEVGASILNDVSGLADDELAEVVAQARGALVLMHHGGQIRGRPRHPRYEDVVSDVLRVWDELSARAKALGVDPQRIVVDPGLDFGKTTWHSLEIVRRFAELLAPGWPVLVAPSRKDVVGETLGLEPHERLEGTLALVSILVQAGASIVRTHDVAATIRAVRMVEAVGGARPPAAAARGLWD